MNGNLMKSGKLKSCSVELIKIKREIGKKPPRLRKDSHELFHTCITCIFSNSLFGMQKVEHSEMS